MALTLRTHKGSWEDTKVIALRKLVQGHLVTFLYESATRNPNKDKRPFVMFLGHDRKKKVMHGISLNYLNKMEISKLFKKMNDFMGEPLTKDNQIKLVEKEPDRVVPEQLNLFPELEHEIVEPTIKPYTKNVALTKLYMGGDNDTDHDTLALAEKIYINVVKPFLKQIKKEIYRSYSWKNVKSLREVVYKWDVSDYNRI